jgi:hypothetical protein
VNVHTHVRVFSANVLVARMCDQPVAFEPPWLYYWDDRDGPGWQGWWIAPAVGSESFMAFAPGDFSSPAGARAWVGDWLLDVHVAELEHSVLAVRAAGMAFEGAYTRLQRENHGKPVYRRERDLSAAEVAFMGEDPSDVVIYGRQMPLARDSASRPVEGVPVGVALDITRTALGWVTGSGSLPEGFCSPSSGEAAATEGAASVAVASAWPMVIAHGVASASPTPSRAPRRTVHVDGPAGLDVVVSKGPDEWLSVPELADDEDWPLPVGWVLAERSILHVTSTVRELLETAIAHLSDDLPESLRTLPQVLEQVRTLRRLLEQGGFRVCAWSDEE